MLQGWPEYQSTAQKIPLPEFDIPSAPRDGMLMSSNRQRTSQACDKCRERKTKCSGDRPVCKRCTTRGLICTYSCREPRPRGLTKLRPRALPTVELPTVVMGAGSQSLYGFPPVEAPHRQSRQQQQQSILQARALAKTDLLASAPILTESPSRQSMSRDFRQFESRRLNTSMFLSTREVQPMVRDAGQIQPLSKMAGGAPLEGGMGSATATRVLNRTDHNLMTPVASSTPLGLNHPFQIQSNGPFGIDYNADGKLRYTGRSTPPSLSHSTSTSVTHSPSSSEHDLEAHHQRITNFELLMASYENAMLYEHPSHDIFGRVELLADSNRRGAELQYPTPVTPIGVEKMEIVKD